MWNQTRPVYNRGCTTISIDRSRVLANIHTRPILYQKSSIFYQKSPMFHRKNPILYQRSPTYERGRLRRSVDRSRVIAHTHIHPTFYQTSSILYQKSLISLERDPYSIKIALHTTMEARLYAGKIGIEGSEAIAHTIIRPIVNQKTIYLCSKKALYCIKRTMHKTVVVRQYASYKV